MKRQIVKRQIPPAPKSSSASAEDSLIARHLELRVNETSEVAAPSPIAVQPADVSLTPLTKYWSWIVLLFVVWQPFELGFYLDDWSVQAYAARIGDAFSKERFQAIFSVDPSRPGLAVTRYALSSLLGGRPLLWQLAMLLANGFVALGLARAARAITGNNRPGADRVALSIALAWMLLPWSASSQFWTILLPVELTLALFAYLLARIFERESPSFGGSVIDCIIYFWICISYEAFYGQFVAVLLLGVGLLVTRNTTLRAVVFNCFSLGTAQILAVLWYYESGKVTKAQKGIDPTWIVRTLHNLKRAVPEMMASATETIWVLEGIALGLTVFAGCILWRSRREWASARQILGSMIIALACIACGALSIVCFSLGGRMILALGVENRSLVLLSFWLTLLAALAAIAALPIASPRAQKVLAWSGLAFGITLGMNHTVRVQEWASAWSEQQAILRSAPLEQLNAVEANARIVFVNPVNVKGAPVFAASWDINHALPLTYPALRTGMITVYNPWEGGPLAWDGNQLGYVGQPPLSMTRNVYVWIPLERSFRKMDRPFRIGADLKVIDLP